MVVGGDGLWNVHVHVDDVGAAVEAGIAAGRPHRIRVTHFAEQVAGQTAARTARTTTRTGRQVVAVAAGPGLEKLFEEAGATVVVGGPGNRPSTGMILDAIHVLRRPGGHRAAQRRRLGACGRGRRAHGRGRPSEHRVRVAVIPTEAQVQGLAALAVHEPGRAFDQDVLEMTATARHARHGAVTIAAKQAMTMAGPCEPGDVLGVVAGDFAVVGADLDDGRRRRPRTAARRRRRAGHASWPATAARRARAGATAEGVERRHPHVDVMVYDGGQERYPLLMSVE